MKIKSILLGSTAALLVAGAASTANAADAGGLVVTSAANYLSACGTNGLPKGPWCLTIAGALTISNEFGTELTFGLDPADAGTGTAVQPHTFSATTRTLSIQATRQTDHGLLTVNIPILGTTGVSSTDSTTLYITLGDMWRFDARGVTVTVPLGGATVAFRVANPGTIGWTDPVKNSTAAPIHNSGSGPWPDFSLVLKASPGNIALEGGLNAGQRFQTLPVPFANAFWTYGGYMKATIGASTAFHVEVGDRFDRVDAWDGSNNPVFAWGAHVEAFLPIGDRVTLNGGVAYGHNYGGSAYTGQNDFNDIDDILDDGYHFQHQELGNYWEFYAGSVVKLTSTLTLSTTVDYNTGPVADDALLAIAGNITWKPSSASPLQIGVTAQNERLLGTAVAGTAVALSVGVTF